MKSSDGLAFALGVAAAIILNPLAAITLAAVAIAIVLVYVV
jgi:hypothetical protein